MMKTFLRTNYLIPSVLMVFLVCFTLVGYFWPLSAIGNLIRYYNGVSSLIIALLTLAYVITTNRQLLAMQKQLNVMDSSVKLQIQPLPVPYIREIRLEKIGAFKGPETNFSKIHILSRFHFDIDFKNAGTGAALNIAVFASIVLRRNGKEEKEIEIPQTHPNQIPLICEAESQKEDVMNSFMIIDNQFEVFRALSAHDAVILKLRIYYKNIFGSGFLEEAQYLLRFESEQDDTIKSWKDFVEDGMKAFNEDVVRFESLISKLPKEAEGSFDKIRDRLKERFDKDIKLAYRIEPSSFNVRIVSFEESLEAENSHYKNLLKSYSPGTYSLLEGCKGEERGTDS